MERLKAIGGASLLILMIGGMGVWSFVELHSAAVHGLVHGRRGQTYTWPDEPVSFGIDVAFHGVTLALALGVAPWLLWFLRNAPRIQREFDAGVKAREADLERRYAEARASRTVRPAERSD